MDGDPITGEPSKENEPADQMTLGEIFTRLCPQYMAIGMSYDDFWHRNTSYHKAFREAHELRLKSEEWARWRQGAYIYDALLRVAPVMRAAFSNNRVEPGKYPSEPWPLTEKEAREREERRELENYRRFIAQMEASSKRELKRREEAAKKEAIENGGD